MKDSTPTHTIIDGQHFVVKTLEPVSREQSLRRHRLLAPATRREREASEFARFLAGEAVGATLVGSLRFRISSDGVHTVAQK